MAGFVACLWLFSRPFYLLFCGHSIFHTLPRGSRVLLLSFE